jgi:hypothetical protein
MRRGSIFQPRPTAPIFQEEEVVEVIDAESPEIQNVA